jgi:hypothetical protein
MSSFAHIMQQHASRETFQQLLFLATAFGAF